MSETAFVSKLPSTQVNDDTFLIRWFTSTIEVPLCGHATLATTHVLLNEKEHKFSNVLKSCKLIKYVTKDGSKLECLLGKMQSLTLNFPANQPVPFPTNDQPKWLATLYTLMGANENIKLIDVQWSASTKKLLLRLDSASDDGQQILTKLKPNFAELERLDTGGMVRGVIVTQKATFLKDKVHFWSRYFAPWNGIEEDPVTGSAHTVLTPYWKKNEKEYQLVDVLLARQLSQRSGLIANQVSSNGRIHLSGIAKTFAKGTFQV